MQIEDVWPLFKLRLLTPRLELRPVRDEDFPALVESALAGIHDPERMPFGVPWTDAPPEQLSPSLAQYHWRMRANVSPERWGISFTVLLGGDPIGIQELHAHNFANLRTVESGSWLTRSAQGKGLGTENACRIVDVRLRHPEGRMGTVQRRSLECGLVSSLRATRLRPEWCSSSPDSSRRGHRRSRVPPRPRRVHPSGLATADRRNGGGAATARRRCSRLAPRRHSVGRLTP